MKKTVFAALIFAAAGAWAAEPVVAVAPFEARAGISAADADTITEIYSIRLSAARVVRVVTRGSLDKVIREHGFQAGDWSNDAKTAALGEALNADWIVRGALQKLGANLVVTVTILDIKSLQVMGGGDIRIAGIDDAYDNMSGLVSQTVQTLTGRAVASTGNQAAGEYKVGDFGPAGGWIFYDKGRVINGWRYLEAAPAETEFTAYWWGFWDETVGKTAAAIGTGKRNTELIVGFLRGHRTVALVSAAEGCDTLVFEGYDDWFLPSKDELDLMYKNLKAKGLGEFSDTWYWSSTEYDGFTAFRQDFRDGERAATGYDRSKRDTLSVRAVRAF
jgi:TolB-like protein